ncbi:MAG: hypothetical protein DMF03_14035 [Verrucomicrobia bacterium]|nr:MAG: hypothetical protein DMF03_14035 [Verrucomicrobiota bacterium]
MAPLQFGEEVVEVHKWLGAKSITKRNFTTSARKQRTLILQPPCHEVCPPNCSVIIMESNLQGLLPTRAGIPAAAGSFAAKIQPPLSYEFCPRWLAVALREGG